MNLSIIIVDYKTTVQAEELASQLTHPGWEVVVVDNNVTNRGYGGGLNFGVAQTKGEYLLFLNPDITITTSAIAKLLSYIKSHPQVGVVGPQFVDRYGKIEQTSMGALTPMGVFTGLTFLRRLFPKNRFSRELWLDEWDRTTTRPVGAVNGACLLVRRSDFEAVGGFDESFFLYWEENDLCDRMRAHKKQVVFLAQVQVKHVREMSMRQSDQHVSAIFSSSRSRYLHKLFGTWMGTLLSVWIWMTEEWRAGVLLAVALFVRLKDLATIPMIDDVMRDYREALMMLGGKGVPLLGIPSSVPRFSQGPLNIWFDALAFKALGVSYVSPVILAAGLTSFTTVYVYLVLRQHVHKNIAFLSAMLIALSPAAIAQTRLPFYLFAIPLFVLFFLQKIMIVRQANARSVFWAVLSFCLLFQWELATIPFVVVLFYAFYRARIRLVENWKSIFLAVGIGLAPQILFDITHQCRQLCRFVVWMGYRTVDVAGVDGRHGLVLFSSDFWSHVVFQLERIVGFGDVGLVIVVLCISLGCIARKKMKSKLFFYTLLSSFCLLVGLIIHGDPSEAYFPPFLTLLPVLLAFGLQSIL